MSEDDPGRLDRRIRDRLSELQALAPGSECSLEVFLVDDLAAGLFLLATSKAALRFGFSYGPVSRPGPPSTQFSYVPGVTDTSGRTGRRVATEAAILHAPLVADIEAMLRGTALDSSTLGYAVNAEVPGVRSRIRSILAIPVFDLDIYQPSPMMRSVVGVVSIASNVTAIDIIKNARFREAADRLGSSLVLQFRASQASERDLGRWQAPGEEIGVPWHEWMEPAPAQHEWMGAGFNSPIEDALGHQWYLFQPGRYAESTALEEFRSVQARRKQSEMYVRNLRITRSGEHTGLI